ncbi:MAG: cytochrome c biogenesis protein ResB [Pseudomonadota bacterium]
MRLWRLLGSHQLATALLGGLALLVALGGTLPQTARLSPQERQGWQQEWSVSSGWLDSLRLSDMFGAWWFWALCAVLLLNLLAGTLQLTLRLRAAPTLAAWGLVVGHGGLLVIVAGAMLSARSGFGAHLELTEGEIWHGAADKLVVDRGRAGGFDGVLRLDQVEATVGQDSRLRELQLGLSWQESNGVLQQGMVSANRPVTVAGYRIYPDNTFGKSAVLERLLGDGSRRLLLVHFPLPRAQWGSPRWQAEHDRALNVGDEIRAFRLRLEGDPVRLHMTVSRGAEILFEGWLQPGDSVTVGGERMTLRQVSPWAGLYLAADRGAPWVFAGMLLAVAGFCCLWRGSIDGVRR